MGLGTAQSSLILLTGATGYVGGRLLQSLEQSGHRVRCLARRPEFLTSKVAPTTDAFFQQGILRLLAARGCAYAIKVGY